MSGSSLLPLHFSLYGVIFVVAVYSLSIIGHFLLPSTEVAGYVCDHQGNALHYRLNGVIVYFFIFFLYFQLPVNIQLIPYTNFSSILLTCHAIGTFTSLYFFLTSKSEKYAICITRNQLDGKGKLIYEPPLTQTHVEQFSLATFYTGREWNPRIRHIDMKVLLYLIGAIQLQINIFAAALYQKHHDGSLTYAMTVYTISFAWFIIEYLIGERVHLYTYDFFAEKVGMKLCWGCLTFYPCFYCVGIFPLVEHIPHYDISFNTSILILVLYLCGWCITRGANLQKYYYRTNPQQQHIFFGMIRQETLPDTRILISGKLLWRNNSVHSCEHTRINGWCWLASISSTVVSSVLPVTIYSSTN